MFSLRSFLSPDTPYLEYVVGFAACISCVHLYLDYRQLKVGFVEPGVVWVGTSVCLDRQGASLGQRIGRREYRYVAA